MIATCIAAVVLCSALRQSICCDDRQDPYWGFGITAATLGDIDGDGCAEFVVGAPSPEHWIASLYAFSGSEPHACRFTLHGEREPLAFFGDTTVAMGDIDGDGAGDFSIREVFSGLRMVSGLDGHTIHDLPGDTLPDGWWIDSARCAAGDIDGDGVSDLVIGTGIWYAEPDVLDRGVAVFSGADGCLIRFARWTDWSGFGVAGDVDRDGCCDILVSRSNGWSFVPTDITFRILSGRDMRELRQFTFSSPSSRLHVACAPLRDANGDGIADMAIGLVDESSDGVGESGRVAIVSGADGSTLRTLDDGGAWNRFGYSVADAGDVDFDGCSDVIVGSYMDDWLGPRRGEILLFSGRTGELIRRWTGSQSSPVGVFVGAAGDLNCDGVPDQFASAVSDQNDVYGCGTLFLLSGFDGTVLARLGSAGHSLTLDSR